MIVSAAGVLLTRVIWVKPGTTHPFAIVDAAMNDRAQPAMYDAYHRFASVVPRGERIRANIAGPVCETGDTSGLGRDIDAVVRGDLAVSIRPALMALRWPRPITAVRSARRYWSMVTVISSSATDQVPRR